MRIRRFLSVILASVVLVFSASAAYAEQYVYLGASGYDANNPAVYGVASKMTQPGLSPAYPSGTPYKFYWVSTTFPDGTFYQVGYMDPPKDSDCTGLMLFVQVWVNGTQTKANQGSCGTTGTRTFGIVPVSSSGSTGTWAVQMDNQELYGNRITTNSYFLSNRTLVISEVSTGGTFQGSAPGLPAVTYSPAMHVKYSNGWGPQPSGRVYRLNESGKFITPCPTYYVDPLGGSAIRVYSASGGGTCRGNGATLW